MTKDELKDYIKSLSPLPDEAPEFTWLGRRIALRKHTLNDNPDNFLEWATIQATMNTNPNHQDYHLDIWENRTGLKVSNLKSIIEFGGGYGAMIKQVYKRGFTGQYYSFDFPELVALQRFYNPAINILDTIPDKADLLIGICSISESDLITRNSFLTSFDFNHCLIRYQHKWDDIDNHLYFDGMLGDRFRDEVDKNHWYLVR